MGAAAAAILRDTSIGLLFSDMVRSSLSLDACTTERTSAVPQRFIQLDVAGPAKSFISVKLQILGPIRGIPRRQCCNKVEHAP